MKDFKRLVNRIRLDHNQLTVTHLVTLDIPITYISKYTHPLAYYAFDIQPGGIGFRLFDDRPSFKSNHKIGAEEFIIR